MTRTTPLLLAPTLAALALALPLAAGAQAFRCTDPATGRVLYTDQPCDGGNLVVPAVTPDEHERRRQAQSDAWARQSLTQQQALERERLNLERERLQVQREAVQASRPQDSAACREARANADWLAGSRGVSAERLRTARYNAALACGQQPPAETTLVEQPSYTYTTGGYHHTRAPGYGGYVGGRFGGRNASIGFGASYGRTGYRGGYTRPLQPAQRFGTGATNVTSGKQVRFTNSQYMDSYPARVQP